jgi:L-lactate dehydrogenase complex protein LldE
MKAALFIPCLTEHFYPQSGISMTKILEHFGVKVEYVEGQTCCGQPAFNSGYRNETIPVAEKFIRLFYDKDYIVGPSGSCVAFVKCFYDELKIDKNLIPLYKELQKKIFEFTEFMVDVLKVDSIPGEFNHKVTYHDSCHPLRELKIHDQPRKLINSIRNIDFVEMERADICCGFGGTFSAKFEDVSVAMTKTKCKFIEESGVEFCVGSDSSCLMNIEGYMKKHNIKSKTLHIAELIAESMKL